MPDQDAIFNVETDGGPQFSDFDYGSKASFATQGTPYVGSRYSGASSVPYPDATAPPRHAVSQVQDSYFDDALTPGGRFVGSPKSSFGQGLSRSELEDAGVLSSAESSSFLAPIGGRFMKSIGSSSARFGLGFGLYQAGEGFARAYEQENSGAYLTPEQQSTAQAGVLPGLGSLLGTAAGAFFGPAGAMIGGFAGQGAGAGVQGFIGASNERSQSTREAAELLNTSSGGAAENIQRLAEAISSLSAPAQVIKDTIGSIVSGVGPVGNPSSAALGGLDRMVNGLGEYAGQSYKSTAAQLRDPALFGLSQQFTSNLSLDVGGYASLGASAILNNNPGNLIDRERDIQTATLNANPAYAADRAAGAGETPWLENLVFGDLRKQLRLGQADKIAGATRSNPAIAALNRYSTDYRASEYDAVLDEGTVGLAAGDLNAAGLRGGGMAEIGAAASALTTGLTGAAQNERYRRDVMQRMMDDPLFKGDRTEIQRQLNQSDLTAQGYETQALQVRRSVFGQQLQTDISGNNLGNIADTLGGKSAAQQAPGDIAFASGLISRALDRSNPLSDAERNQLQAQGLQSIYQTQMGVFQETLNANSANTARAGVAVTQAQNFGGPADVAQAQSGVLREFQDRIRELTQEISSGTLTVADRTNAERELSQTRAGAISLQASIGRDESLGNAALAATGRDTVGVGLDRLLALGGNAGLPSAALLGADRANLAAAQGLVANNPQQRAERDLAIRQAQLGLSQDATLTQTFRQSATQSAALDTAQTDFQISRLSPFQNGSNPISATDGYLGSLRATLGAAQRNDRGTTDPLARAENTRTENALRLQIAGLEGERETYGLGLLPETIAGLPGRGFGSAVTPVAGVSAFYSPNSRVSGSFGGGGSTPSPLAGGAVAGFGAASGADAAIAEQRTTNQLLRQILAGGNRSSAPVHQVGAGVQGANNSYSPQMRK